MLTGYTPEGDELYTMTDLLITEINLGYTDVDYSIAGNQILQQSTFVIDGNTRDIVDASQIAANDNVPRARFLRAV